LSRLGPSPSKGPQIRMLFFAFGAYYRHQVDGMCMPLGKSKLKNLGFLFTAFSVLLLLREGYSLLPLQRDKLVMTYGVAFYFFILVNYLSS
jgi:hypothetical protein